MPMQLLGLCVNLTLHACQLVGLGGGSFMHMGLLRQKVLQLTFEGLDFVGHVVSFHGT